jgi:hypothetical protein
MTFLQNDLPNQDNHDISLFTININSKNKASLSPYLGEFHWIYKLEKFFITYKDSYM